MKDKTIDGLIAASRAARTREAEIRMYAHFITWCVARGAAAFPATDRTVLAYLHECAGRMKATSVIWHAAMLSALYRDAGERSLWTRPQIARYLEGLRRACRDEPTGEAAPLLLDDVRRVVAALPADLGGARDRALILVGWSGAFRAGELQSMRVADIQRAASGLLITLPVSKTGQKRAQRVAIPEARETALSARLALEAWFCAAAIREGAVFRPLVLRGGRPVGVERQAFSGRGMNRALLRALERAGIDPEPYSMHSLRAGLVTTLHAAGATIEEIQRITRHRSRDMVLRYVRAHADPFRGHPLGRLL